MVDITNITDGRIVHWYYSVTGTDITKLVELGMSLLLVT